VVTIYFFGGAHRTNNLDTQYSNFHGGVPLKANRDDTNSYTEIIPETHGN